MKTFLRTLLSVILTILVVTLYWPLWLVGNSITAIPGTIIGLLIRRKMTKEIRKFDESDFEGCKNELDCNNRMVELSNDKIVKVISMYKVDVLEKTDKNAEPCWFKCVLWHNVQTYCNLLDEIWDW